MKTILLFVIFCLPVFAADTNEIQIFTRSYKILPDSLATIEVFTRSGETNLVRQTHTKDGVVSFRNQSFYYHGIKVGSYLFEVANGPHTGVGSEPGCPYYFNVNLDASNQPLSAQIRATNIVLLDWFLCTNGIFYPAENLLIQEANTRLPKLPAK